MLTRGEESRSLPVVKRIPQILSAIFQTPSGKSVAVEADPIRQTVSGESALNRPILSTVSREFAPLDMSAGIGRTCSGSNMRMHIRILRSDSESRIVRLWMSLAASDTLRNSSDCVRTFPAVQVPSPPARTVSTRIGSLKSEPTAIHHSRIWLLDVVIRFRFSRYRLEDGRRLRRT